MENMTRLQPTHYDVYPVYTCACGAEWQQTIDQTEFPAGILCHCGAKLKLDTIESLEVHANFKSDGKPKERSMSHQNLPDCDQKDDIYEDVVPALVSMGFKKKEARNIIDKHYVEGITPEDLVGEILRGEKNGNCIEV